ncbi:hypothetical protein [Ostreiculturibacter nitratireducens]|uniref:TadE/TadG family type IV pilus assembly protein n=1 Tax=Ostreiculturibacter nitratireducens TaxID=3075226 RepID=UPI0031B56F26
MRTAKLFRSLSFRFRLFRARTEGSMSVEAVLILPLLVWWYVAAFQFFEAFRERTVNEKAAFTITDMITRETLPVDANYIDGMGTVFDYLTNSDEQTWVRVTSVRWNDNDKVHNVEWSYATRSQDTYNNGSIKQVANRIPAMAPNDTVVIVETHSSLAPIFEVGVSYLDFDQFVVMRPRFVPAVLWGDRSGNMSG